MGHIQWYPGFAPVSVLRMNPGTSLRTTNSARMRLGLVLWYLEHFEYLIFEPPLEFCRSYSGSVVRDHSWQIQWNICGARDRFQVSHMQEKSLTYCTISQSPRLLNFKWYFHKNLVLQCSLKHWQLISVFQFFTSERKHLILIDWTPWYRCGFIQGKKSIFT